MVYFCKGCDVVFMFICVYVNFNIYFILSNWDGASLGVGALRKRCTVSGGTVCIRL